MLNTPKVPFRCILCESKDYQAVAPQTRDSDQRIIKCQKCSHIQIFPLPKTADENKFYNEDEQTRLLYKNIDIEEFEKRASFDTQRRIGLIENNFKRNISILDIGCGYGFFIKLAKDAGFNATGLEVSKERREIAQKVTGEKILPRAIQGKNKSGKKYDVITLFHVLEHIKNPIELARDLKTYLKPNGTIIIEVPNANDYLLTLNRNYKDFFWQRAHISYFTPETINEVLKKAGHKNVKIIGIQRYSFQNALNWISRGKPQLQNPKYGASKFKLIESIYKNFLAKNLICDTLWIEAKVN